MPYTVSMSDLGWCHRAGCLFKPWINARVEIESFSVRRANIFETFNPKRVNDVTNNWQIPLDPLRKGVDFGKKKERVNAMLFSIAVGFAMLFRINIDYMFRACVFIGFMEYKIMYCPIHTPYILRNLCCSDYCDLFPRLVMCWENSHVQTTAKQCLHTQQKTSKQQANKFNQTSGRDGSAIAEWFMLLDGTHACSASICMLMPDEQYLGQMQRLLSGARAQ